MQIRGTNFRVPSIFAFRGTNFRGIPQGSVIGPIVFVIFINDMLDVVKYNFRKLFADDCKLFGKVVDAGDNLVQADLTNLEEW